jgi:probable rRNA maturation factor
VSIAIGVNVDGTRIPVSRARIVAAARTALVSQRARNVMLSITFVSDRAIRALNKRHLRRDRTTDVIAFGFRRRGHADPIVGDVYIAPGVARASARSNGISVREEIIRLVVHGTLHVLGHDHPESEARSRSPMWRTQERLVSRLMLQGAR